jgi:hypothetical protein
MTPRAAALLVAAAVLLRLVLLLVAETRLDADESTVGVMALDVLEGRAFPFFFYGNAYNGGAALESWLGAVSFAVLGPSALALRLVVLVEWTLAAALFSGLCRRALPGSAALLAMLFFCFGTPFFLEWSLKARGGFAETVLFSCLLLWLAEAPPALRERPRARAALFGLATGIGLWSSEMLLPMAGCAAVWLLARAGAAERRRVGAWLAAGALVGLLPLGIYDLTHDAAHLRQSVLASLAAEPADASDALSLRALLRSAGFVLGPAWALLLAGLAAAALRIARRDPDGGLGRVALAHVLLYLAAYWLSGPRYLPDVPPSRVLYALLPSLSVLLALAAAPAQRARITTRALSLACVVAWLVSVTIPVAGWIGAGRPREAGSWRGSWALVDGEALRLALLEEGVEIAYASHWTTWSLLFAVRAAEHRDEASRALSVASGVPRRARGPARRAAIALHAGSPSLERTELALREAGVPYRRREWGDLVLLVDLDATRIQRGIGLPARFGSDAWPPLPDRPDGFN